jgi:hypothetical protein
MTAQLRIDEDILRGCIARLDALCGRWGQPGGGPDALEACLAQCDGAGADAARELCRAMAAADDALLSLVTATRAYLQAALDEYLAADAAASAQASRIGG